MSTTSPPPPRRRLSATERRRQLIGIGLSQMVETPIQELSMDQIAAEAGISRGLLFHYFATKSEFHLACIEAAGRRILRTTAPDPEAPGPAQVEAMVRQMVSQIERRRAFYLALVRGQGTHEARVADVVGTVRRVSTERVLTALGLAGAPAARPVVHAWWAYVEDRAIGWSAPLPAQEAPGAGAIGERGDLDDVVAECTAALAALLALKGLEGISASAAPSPAR